MSDCEVNLVALTVPRVPGVETAEEFVAYAARVSNPENQMNSETAPKLLKYLAKNRHWSPFEMVHVVMEIETTRDIARQILRHRSFSFQEFSQRYATIDSLGFSKSEARFQDLKNRQNSIETDDDVLKADWEDLQHELLQIVRETYAWALDQGIAKELARKVLPEGLTNSRMYMSGTVRSWIHYIQERTQMGVQKEHRLIAEQVKTCFLTEFPSLSYLLNGQ